MLWIEAWCWSHEGWNRPVPGLSPSRRQQRLGRRRLSNPLTRPPHLRRGGNGTQCNQNCDRSCNNRERKMTGELAHHKRPPSRTEAGGPVELDHSETGSYAQRRAFRFRSARPKMRIVTDKPTARRPTLKALASGGVHRWETCSSEKRDVPI